MATRRPIVLVSGVQSELPVGDNIDGALYQGQQIVAGSGLVGGGLFTTDPRIDVGLATNPSGLYFTGDNKLGFDGQGDNIQVIASGVGAVYRTVQDKSRDIVSVKDFGAVGDGVTDDASSILKAFDYARANPGTAITFPKATYLVSFGFYVPTDTTILLNGSTLKATTTFWQGAQPANSTNSFFRISNGATALGGNTIKNVTIDGAGAVLDGRRNEQTGTIAGYTLIAIETSDTPIQADLWKIFNVTIKDLVLERSGYDGVYISGADNVTIQNVTCNRALRIGFVTIASRALRYINCSANFTVGDNPGLPANEQGPGNSGEGFWNEPNYTWQSIDAQYVNCRAYKNYQAGFKIWNAGADAETNIEAYGCIASSNYWDEVTSALRSAPGGGFQINLNDTGAASFQILLKDCTVDTVARRGFSIQRGNASGANYAQKIILDNCTAINCNIDNNSGMNGAPFAINSATGYPLIILNSCKAIAPAANTQGYGIAVFDPTNVYVLNPAYAGVFSSSTIFAGTYPASRLDANKPTMLIDPAADDTVGGLTGNATKYFKPVRLSTWDQTAQPSVADDLFANELAVWQDDNNQFTGIFKRDDSDTPKYIDLRAKKRIRFVYGWGGGTVNTGTQTSTADLSVPGAALNDIVQVSLTVDLQGCIATGYVVSADTIKILLTNLSGSNRTFGPLYFIATITSSDY